tara:strand:- start:283 stop:555 length:273 start_codon:yes stop_codon:yes gene_type:complete
MELSDIPVWQWVVALWASTWVIVIFRTWSRIVWLLQASAPRHKMLEQPFLHWVVYAICINFVLPLMGISIVLYDEKRDQWVKAYVTALMR